MYNPYIYAFNCFDSLLRLRVQPVLIPSTLIHDAETIERDKPLETVVNGFSLNGRTTGSLGPLGSLGTNHSSLGNGHLQPNGLLMHANTITITGNPLDDKVCV